MPRPPVLPVVDWKSVFEAALPFKEWLKGVEFEESIEQMEQSKKLVTFDVARMERLSSISAMVRVLAIAEDWCGDVILHVPVLEALAAHSEMLKVRYIPRAQYPEIFIRYLTNGGEAIPKFIFFNNSYVECGNWGPMPMECRKVLSRGKAAGNIGGARKIVGAMYAADENKEIVTEELLELIEIAATTQLI